MANITGEQFKTGLKQMAQKVVEKIDNLPDPVINEYYNVRNANIIGGDVFSKERAMLARYDIDRYNNEPYLPDRLNLNRSMNMTTPPVFEMDNDLGRKVAVFNATQKQFIPLGKFPKTPQTSVSFMIKRDDWSADISSNESIMSCTESGGFRIFITTKKQIEVMAYINGGYKTYGGTKTIDTLTPGYHVFTITFDGYDIRTYVDNDLFGEMNISTNGTKYNMTYNSDNGIFIGAEASTGTTKPEDGYFTTFKLAEARFYSKGLTEKEVSEVYDEMIHHIDTTINSAITVQGDVIQQVIIDELKNPLTMNPLEYGSFAISQDQTTNFDVNSPILFDTIEDGNLSVIRNTIELRGAVTYNIKLAVVAETTRLDVRIKNMTTGEFIGKKLVCTPPNSTLTYSPLQTLDFNYTPKSDSEIQVIITENDNTIKILSDFTSLSIQEIRNNPVVQYGGFQSVVLFEGIINNTGVYTLGDNTDNYSAILLQKNPDDALIPVHPVLTSNTAPEGYEAFASNEYSTDYKAYKAFDGKNGANTHSWLTRKIDLSEVFIGIRFPQPLEVTHVDIIGPTGYSAGSDNNPPKHFIIQGTNQDTNEGWQDIVEITDQDNWLGKESRIFKLPPNCVYKAYRILVKEKGSHKNNQVGIGEIRLLREIPLVMEKVHILVNPNRSIYNEELRAEISGNTLNITAMNNTRIHKVIGIKGGLPSLLIGGEF